MVQLRVKPKYRTLTECRICDGTLEEVYRFRDVPLANSYCTSADHEDVYYPLTLMRCNVCGLAQLREEVSASELYGGEYAYIPSTSQTMRDHFKGLAAAYAPNKVLEIGCNDGTLLREFSCQTVGIDPAANLNPDIVGLFNEQTAREILSQYGLFDLIVTTNTLANAHDIPGILRGARDLLTADGLFVVETPDFMSLIEKGSYDSIYHEHMAYLTEDTLTKMLKQYRFDIVDVQRFPIHGGTLRVTARRAEKLPYLGVGFNDYRDFPKRAAYMASNLHDFLRRAADEGKRVVGYGAPAKATVLLHQAEVERGWIEYVTDTIPYKQGKMLPGLHIPIHPPERLSRDFPEVLLVLCWNFRDEVLPKLQAHRDAGTRIVFPVPELEVV